MYLQELFQKYSEWKIIYFFLKNPQEKIHLKELARKIGVSPGTASKTLNKAAQDDILTKEVVGNVHLYTLNENNNHVKQLEKAVSGL